MKTRTVLQELLQALDESVGNEGRLALTPEVVSAMQEARVILQRDWHWTILRPTEPRWYWCADPGFEEGEPHPVMVGRSERTPPDELFFWRDGKMHTAGDFIDPSIVWAPMDAPHPVPAATHVVTVTTPREA